jgi:ketosteroid isomerase-like protein
MAELSRAPLAVALSFIDAINRGDIARLAQLMAEDYELRVFEEAARRGRQQGLADWRAYLSHFPDYIILPHKSVATGDLAAVLGTTIGSHLGLADAEEMKLTLIWLAKVEHGKVRNWTLVADTLSARQKHDLER